MANWKLIKEQWCSEIPARELATIHKIKADTITRRASVENWEQEKSIKNKEKVEKLKTFEEQAQKKLEEATTLGIKRLYELLENKEIKPNELISAIRLAFDTTLLNKNKEKKEDDLPPPNITIQF